MSETINPNTGRSDADVYQEAEDVLARATALLNKTVSRPDLNTGGGTGNFTYDFGNTNSDDVLNSLLTQAGETANKEIDEDKIRRDTLRLFQSEIDATNNIYDDLVNRQEQVNANNEGGLRAVQNRQGLVGSGRGAAQSQEIRDQGQQAIGAINAERATRISNILGTARKEALDEITAKREAQQAGASAYLTYIEMEDERKQGRLANVITALINQGIDPSEMSEQELSQVARNIGVPVQDLLSGYKTATADQREREIASSREAAVVSLLNQGVSDPKELFDYLNYDEQGNKVGDISLDEITKITKALESGEDAYFNLSEGQSRYVRNPDGTVTRVAYNPKTYAPKDSDPRNDDFYFKFTNDDSGLLIDANFSQGEIQQIERDLNEYGVEAVVEGMNDAQAQAIRNIVQNKTASQREQESGEVFLDKDYFKNLYTMDQLEESAAERGYTAGGFFGIGVGRGEGEGVDQYLDWLMSLVEQYREAGYSDKEILDMFPKK